MNNFNPKRPPNIQNIAEIMKNNELFANSLTFKILGKETFLKVLQKGGFTSPYIDEYTAVIEKFLEDYEARIKEYLNNI